MTGAAPVAKPDQKSAVRAQVVELDSYRAPQAAAKQVRPSVDRDIVVEEEKVGEMQGLDGVDAVNQAPKGVPPAPRSEDAVPLSAIAEVDPAVEPDEDSLEQAAAPPELDVLQDVSQEQRHEPDASQDVVEPADAGESGEAIEAKESDPSDDGDEPDEGDAGGEEGGEPQASGEDGDEGDDVEGDRLDSILESLLLAAGAPIPVRRMCDALRSGPKAKEVRAALKRLMQRYSGDCGIHLVEVSGGYQFRTAPANADYVRHLLREKPARLGRAALETLSIVAYKQPATRGEIEAIRGVDADSAINSLLAKKLIKIDGRKETVGRPLLYSTTPEFLEVFGLKDLKELPTLKEIGPVPEPENEEDIEDTGIEEGEAAAAIVEAAGENAAAEDELGSAEADAQAGDEQLDVSGAEADTQDDDQPQASGDDRGLEAETIEEPEVKGGGELESAPLARALDEADRGHEAEGRAAPDPDDEKEGGR